MSRTVTLFAVVSLAVAMAAVGSVPQARPALAGTAQTFLVLYKSTAVPANAASTISRAGGTLVYSYSQIGVALARSTSPTFRDALLKDNRIEGVAATADYAVRLETEAVVGDGNDPLPGNVPATDSDPLSGLQWDMVQIRTPEAHAITGGSPAVLVGDIDTGLDWTHPDLAPNVDFANSVSCVGGVPNQDPSAWMDDNGHGTHTAGTIAAASNGIGMVGVAPNVRIAGIKAGNTDGYFFPEAVICSFMWAGSHHFDVTNNSYFADPWLFNCRNDPVQRAIWKAEQRAIRYAMQQGVVVVSSAGNENQDLTHPTVDEISPDYPPGTAIPREVTNACMRIPAEIPGVITVSANGNLGQKSYYSDYGIGVVQVVAPGGDRRYQLTAAAPNGRVLSTFPGAFFIPGHPLMVQDCSAGPCATYAYLQGTSMAGPHVAGVAALVISLRGHGNPGAVQAVINQTAVPQACPPDPFDPGGTGLFLATCQGGSGNNGFYGHGEVDALNAVLKVAGN